MKTLVIKGDIRSNTGKVSSKELRNEGKVPCVVYGVFRYLFLVHKRGAGGAPEKVLLSDAPLLIDGVLFLAIAGWALFA